MNQSDVERRTKRLTRCAEPGCPETPTGGTHRSGKPACRRHATTESLLPIRPDPPPKATDGMISPRAIVGLDETGKRATGGESWEYHEHYASPGLHHDEEIIVGGVLRFRQAPTVYSRHAPMLSPKAAATVARELSESAAARVARALLLGGAVADLAGRPASDIREAISRELGTMSPRQLKRRAKRSGGNR